MMSQQAAVKSGMVFGGDGPVRSKYSLYPDAQLTGASAGDWSYEMG